EHSTFERFLNTLIHRLDVFPRNYAANNLVDEFVSLAGFLGIQLDLDVTVLTAAAGLANVLALGLGMLANRLAIGNLRLTDVGLDLVLAHHAVNDDFKVQLAHTADDRLPAVGIGVNLEGGIFLGQLSERHAHLFLIGFGFRLDRNVNHRHRKFNRLKNDGVLRIADRVAGGDIFQPDDRANVACENFLNVLAFVGVHLQQTANTLVFSSAGVQHRFPGLQLPG